MAFIRHLDEAGGTAQVDEALTTFPVSTEQILHPERWPNDVPQPVDVPDLGPALGDGWHDLDVMTVGEAWLQLMLALRLDADDAARAAAGWDGGIYRAWTDGTRTAVVLRTVWDSTEDAQEFADAMEGMDGRRHVRRPRRGTAVDVGFASDARPHSHGPPVGARTDAGVALECRAGFRRLTAPKRSDLSGGMG